ncbi:MAG: cobyric acid synthase, partial [Alphaproteobacteria bacterium]|nr:cobyric acid synthase [Alphaproteobacteria bacterium]
MLQGTGSDVGKSLLAAGLCRAFTRRGRRVRPFKPQNMSNNAAVTADGGEIGRAQALQARACGVAPSIDMNPVLLKPQSELGAQIVVQGKVLGAAPAREYHAMKPSLMPRVLESFRRLSAEADLVIVEGAGSAAEVNLREHDIANMGFAEAADLPVVLVGDIDRGGVIASLVGTHVLLPEGERARLAGYLINKFRGDPALFEPAIGMIEARTRLPCLGIVPWFPEALRLPAEDAAQLAAGRKAEGAGLRVAVPVLSRIANWDDFDPLSAEPGVALTLVRPGEPLPGDADLVILPGSKATIADLAFLRAQGWDIDLFAHLRRGGRVLGICAGYQMLGRRIADPLGVEGPPGETEGLGLLNVETVMAGTKTLREVEGAALGQPVRGYEMHMGETTGPDRARPFLTLAGRPDGAMSADGRVAGCYLHGLFAADGFRRTFLPGSTLDWEAGVEIVLDRLA